MLVSDNELLGLYVYKDDQAAFEKLIRRHSTMVLSVCSSLLWQKADAEDAFQAVFILLSTKAPKLLKHNSVGGWLHEVAFRISLKHRGKIMRKREVVMSEELKSNSKEPWQTIAESRESELLHREISRLPKRYRDVIVLCHLEGKSRAQAASVLDVTTASVKAALARGRKLLRQRLLKHGIAASVAFGAMVAAAGSASASTAGVSESLIQSTVHHCQGLSPDLLPEGIEAVGNGAEVVQSILVKDYSIMTMGITQSSLAIATGIVTVFALSIAAFASQFPIDGDGVITVKGRVTSYASSPFARIVQENGTQAGEVFPDPAAGNQAIAESLNKELMQLELDLAHLKSQFGPGHPQVLAVQEKIKMLKNQMLGLTLPLVPNPLAKTRAETWLQYVDRLMDVGELDGSQRALWIAGNEITLKKKMAIQAIRTEVRSRTVPIVRMEKEINEDGEVIEVPHTEQVQRHYTIQVPYTALHSSILIIPAPGTQPEDAVNQGFVPAIEPDDPEPPINNAKDSKAKGFKDPVVMRMMAYQPKQSDAKFEEIESSAPEEYTVRRIKGDNVAGFELVTKKSKRVVRKLLDLNNDNKLDTWIFYKDGVETYRDLDLDFNGKVDQSQYIKGDKIRYGIDEDEDGKIDRWEKGRLSDIGG